MIFSRISERMKLIHNSLQFSIGYNAATMIASVHAGRSQVLDHCTENDKANWIKQYKNSKYNGPHLFGVLPNSSRAKYDKHLDTFGQVRLRDGDIKTQVNSKDSKTKPKSTGASSSHGSYTGPPAQKKTKPGQPFCGQEGGKSTYVKAQAHQAKPNPPSKGNSSKKRKGGKSNK